MQKNGAVIEFRYNADGIRTSKNVGGVEHVYTLNDSQKEGIGIAAGASVLEIGYESRYIDVNIEVLTIGITYMYKDGKFELGHGSGWFGWSFSIDLVELYKLLYEGG